MDFVVPPALSLGDCVAVVAPAGPFERDTMLRALAWLRLRYRIRVSPGVFDRCGYLAGTDARRADELSAALRDDQVKAIVAVRGGYGAMRVLDAVDWTLLRERPKWLVGFSDVTALHAVAWSLGIASLHGPNLLGLGRGVPPSIKRAWLDCLEQPTAPRLWRAREVLRAGQGSGPCIGGNLSLIHAMAASGRLVVPAGAVLMLEDVTEAPYRVDRMLTSLRLGGTFADVSAVVFGDFSRCAAGPDGRPLESVLRELAQSLTVPVLAGAPFGHEPHNEAFVLGSRALVADDQVRFNPP